MKISEIIKTLNQCKKAQGNVEVYISNEDNVAALFSLNEEDFEFVETDDFRALIIRT